MNGKMGTSSLDLSALDFSDHHVIVTPDGRRYAFQRLLGETNPGTDPGDAAQECIETHIPSPDSDRLKKQGQRASCLGGRPNGSSDIRATTSDLRAPGTEDTSTSPGSWITIKPVSDSSDIKSTTATIASPDTQSQARSPFASFSTYASFGPIVSSPGPETTTCEELERLSARRDRFPSTSSTQCTSPLENAIENPPIPVSPFRQQDKFPVYHAGFKGNTRNGLDGIDGPSRIGDGLMPVTNRESNSSPSVSGYGVSGERLLFERQVKESHGSEDVISIILTTETEQNCLLQQKLLRLQGCGPQGSSTQDLRKSSDQRSSILPHHWRHQGG